MSSPTPAPEEPSERESDDSSGPLPASAVENLGVVEGFDQEQDAQITPIRAGIERISAFFGSPAYFAFVIAFVVLWVAVNTWGSRAGWRHVDDPPFFWLQGLVSSNALLLTVAVLIRQNRMAELAEHRAHLDLQINLLTERKVSKILQLAQKAAPASAMNDAEADELAQPADPEALLNAIKQSKERRQAAPVQDAKQVGSRPTSQPAS